MPNLTPTSSFDDVPELETATLALGGPGGPMNLPAQALLNRTQWLHDNAVAGSSSPYVAAAGTANAITATYTPAITALADGLNLRFESTAANTGAVTFSPNGLTAYPVLGGALQALQGGEIAAGGEVEVVWNASLTSWVIVAQAGGSLQVADAAQSRHAVSKSQLDAQATANSTTYTAIADLASTSAGKGSKLVAFIQRLTGAVARWVEDKLSEVVSVKDFGAVGDGTTDNTAAIQAAFDSISANGGTIYFPDGIYLCGSITVTGKPVTIRGSSIVNAKVAYTGTTSLFTIAPSSVAQYVSVSNISLLASNATVASGTALTITYPTTSSWSGPTVDIRNVNIQSHLTGTALPYWTNGIVLTDCWNAVLDGVRYAGKANDATIGSFLTLGENCTDVLVANCHAYFCAQAVKQTAYGEGLRIVGSTFVDVGRGYYNTSTSVLGPWISDCHINCATYCIELTGAAQAHIHDCMLYSAIAGAAGCILLSDSSDCEILSNRMYTNQAGISGVTIQNVTGSSQRNFLNNNIFAGFSQPVFLKSGVSLNVIESSNYSFNSGLRTQLVYDSSASVNRLVQQTIGITKVLTLAGGAAFENQNIPVPAGVFVNVPTACSVTADGSSADYLCAYNSTASTATNINIRIVRRDGGTISAGSVRFNVVAAS